MEHKRVGDFLANLVAPSLEPPVTQDKSEAGLKSPAGAPPVDVEVIKAKAGAEEKVLGKARSKAHPNPLLIKEIEVVQLKLKLAETEEELLLRQIQDIRQRRAELVHIQRRLIEKARALAASGDLELPAKD